MSYLNQAQDPRRRVTALSGTIAIQVALAFAVVTGLTIAGNRETSPHIRAVDFPIPKPAKPDPVPDPAPQQQTTVITAPKPPIDLTRDNPPVVARDDPPIVEVIRDPAPIYRPDPPRPIASFVPRGVKPSNNPLRLVTTGDYPGGPLRSEIEGTSGYRVIVGTNGRVSSCEITRPSGNSQLDGATCRYISQRARFDPATDDTGAKVVGTYSGTVSWEIPN